MPSMTILDHEHQQILLEDRARRLQNEHRFAVPGCPWDCEDGWHEILFSEFDPLDLIPLSSPAVIVLPHMFLFACECNSVTGGRVRHYPDWFKNLLDLPNAHSRRIR